MLYLYRAAPAALFLSFMLHIPAYGTPESIRLEVVGQDGDILATMPLATNDHWCLLWNHSVAGFTVSDCFVNEHTTLILKSSHQPDFAAGLGYMEGRGTLASDGSGGYLISQINEPIPGNVLSLRVGSPAVNHRIAHDGKVVSLSELAAGQRVSLRLSAFD